MFRHRDLNAFLSNYQQFDRQSKKPYEYLNLSYHQQFEHSPIRKQTYTSKPNDIQYKSLQEPSFLRQNLLPNYEPTKCSNQRNGIIKAYAANTNQGIVRDYNEDRVSIILNIIKPQSRSTEQWPKCSFFGVYDGHGGAACADFLRDNLHQFVVKEPDFPWNPVGAITKGFEAAEKQFLQIAQESYNKGVPERSGSCAIVVLVVGDTCYVANVGDSRAVLSAASGRKAIALSHDHKPELEQERIVKGGGSILGPVRVNPGRLSVSRTFGDIEAKFEKFGGNPKVVIAEPEIKQFKITNEHDFIVLGSDGIFDKLSSSDVMNIIWKDILNCQVGNSLHNVLSTSVESVLKESIQRKSQDNVTLLVVAFSVASLKEEELRMKTSSSIEKLVKVPLTNNIPNMRMSYSKKTNDENNPFLLNTQKMNPHQKLKVEETTRYKPSYIN
ncbi:unnamed protein product (macronuclear) [Paramecium tetraurelia]|uniref:protein-serine/threonine phosphatase n=1 Tax=Paramecium tetraurelia TaxID=5888 RepID=A0E9A0_PARTE|nr:uncharacterized protein GSPATT00024598001 [Paramecium tetraurelia]CAK91867.1 unnamed protein product [Paramecium tetraurelia]|eukprot:XP_001459264.1 hypothetical protein (macronuclear) [Paramecium tetraurelia strain d4-2]